MISVNTTGKGIEFLLIHGIMSDQSFFDRLKEDLKEEYRLITYDRSGYGDSEPSEDVSIGSQAETAAEIIRKYADGPVFIIGHSAGGLIGIETALRFPELVKGLILIETPLAVTGEDEQALRRWNTELNGYVQQKRVIKAIPAFHREIGMSEKKESGAAVTSQGLKKIFHNLNAFMLGELNDIQNYEVCTEKIETMALPVIMFLTTEKPDSIYTHSAKSAADAFGWETETLKGAHNVIEAEPEEFAAKVRTIIKKWSE